MRFERRAKRGNPEAHLLLQIIKYCKLKGCYVGKVKVKGSFNKRGFIFDPYLLTGLPDAFCFKGGIMYAIETKVKGNKQTPNQETFQEHFHNPPDRIYIIAYKLEDVMEWVK